MIALVHHPDGSKRLGDLLIDNLSSPKWRSFRAAVAFVKQSGTKHLTEQIRSFLKHGKVKVSVGIDLRGTSAEGLNELIGAMGEKGEAFVFHNEVQSTFHPKVYLFTNDASAECFIGSGNLTEGGLFTNYEAFVHLQLDKSEPDDCKFLAHVEKLLDAWSNPLQGTVRKLTSQLIRQLQDAGDLPNEDEIREERETVKAVRKSASPTAQAEKLFAAVQVKPAPRVIVVRKTTGRQTIQPSKTATIATSRGFVMTLQQTDVGIGQITKGTSKRSPEVFMPLSARDADPGFWGWKSLFIPDKLKPGKWDRFGVRMRLGREIIEVNMMTWPDKHDFRLRNAALRDAGVVGDVLRMEIAERKTGYDYYVEIVPQGSSDYSRYLTRCVNRTRNSKKLRGYY